MHQDIASLLDRHIETDWRVQKQLHKLSEQTRCETCKKDTGTRVERKLSQNGKCWAILCCCFGSPLLVLLAYYMDEFNVYHHYCPSCNSFLGEYSPKMSNDKIGVLLFLSSISIILTIVFVAFITLENSNRNFGNQQTWIPKMNSNHISQNETCIYIKNK